MTGHLWVRSTLGHGHSMCARCKITDAEAAVLGLMDTCEKAQKEEEDVLTDAPKFKKWQKVQKTDGYPWPGVVVSVFTNRKGQIRYVVECTVPQVAGALHIFNEAQLQERDDGDDY